MKISEALMNNTTLTELNLRSDDKDKKRQKKEKTKINNEMNEQLTTLE